MLTSADEVLAVRKQLQAREEAIGVTVSMLAGLPETEFLRRTKPAVSLKTLYSDFVVRELSPFYNNGEPLVLEGPASCALPGDAAAQKNGDASAETRSEADDRKRPRDASGDVGKCELGELDQRIGDAFSPLLGEEDLSVLRQGIQAGEKCIRLSSVTDKEKRKKLHEAVKAVLGSTHVSSTDDGSVVITKANAADRREQNRRSNASRPRRFLHFTLYKENLDTNQAFRTMAGCLHLSTRQFQFCGTKDKRAVTLQRVAIRDLDPRRLASINERASFGSQGLARVSSFREEDHGLKLGDSSGNHFRIVLRLHPVNAVGGESCSGLAWTEPQLRAIEAALGKVGAINYYGPQRFGTTQVLTSDVGLKLLQGDYKAAIELMFSSRACFVPDMKEVLPLLAAGDYDAAQAKVPYHCFQERDMLRYLAKSPKDYLGALQTVPRTLAMLYFHAVQSLVWNRMASRRLTSPTASGGDALWDAAETPATRTSPEVGDLVLTAVYEKRMQLRDATVPLNAWAYIRDSEEAAGDRDQPLPATCVLTKDDDLSLFALSDVVLPVPGPDRGLQFPAVAGCSKLDYEDECKRLGVFEALLSENASSSKNVLLKVFHYHGTYRPLCVQPQRMRITLTTVPSWRAVVVPTDLEELKAAAGNGSPEEDANHTANNEEPVAEAQPVQALVTELSLPPGSYATSVLREFCVSVSEQYHQTAPTAETPPETEAEDGALCE